MAIPKQRRNMRKRPSIKIPPKTALKAVRAPELEPGLPEAIRDFVRKYHGQDKGMRVPEWGTVAKPAYVLTSHMDDSALSWIVYGDLNVAGEGNVCQLERFLFIVNGREFAYTRREVYALLAKGSRPDVLERLREAENPATYRPESHTDAMSAAFHYVYYDVVQKKAEAVAQSANIGKYDKFHLALSRINSGAMQKEIHDTFIKIPEREDPDNLYFGVNVAKRGESRCEVRVNYLYSQNMEYDAFDAVIQNHVASLMLEHEAATGEKTLTISLNRLCAAIYGEYDNPDWVPTPKQAADVRDRLNVMWDSKVKISWDEVVKRKGVATPKKAEVGGRIIEFRAIKVNAGGGVVEGYKFLAIPPAFEYSLEMRQVATISRKLIKCQRNITKSAVILTMALIKVVEYMKRYQQRYARWGLDAIMRETNEDWETMDRRRAQEVREDMEAILNGMVEEKVLADWKWVADDGYNGREKKKIDFYLPPELRLGYVAPPMLQ